MGETQEMVRRKLPLDLGHDAEWLVRAYIAECHGWSVEVDVEGGAALCPRRGSDHDADHGVVRIVDVGRCDVVQRSWCQSGDCQLQSVVGELTARGGTLSKEGPPVAVCCRRKGHNRLWQGPVSKGQPHVAIGLLEEATSRSQQGRCWSVQEEAIFIIQQPPQSADLVSHGDLL